MAKGIDPERGCFVQHYGSTEVDASLLMLALVGFLPPDDRAHPGHHRRRRGGPAVRRVRAALPHRSHRRRAPTGRSAIDGLPPGEGAFLLTTFWLVDTLALVGRHEDAVALFERLLGLRNDVGLLSEEWDPVGGRMVGNFPQAFSHVGLVNTARNLVAEAAGAEGPARRRATVSGEPAVPGSPGQRRGVTLT